MKGKDNSIDVLIPTSKEDFLKYLSTYKHRREYIRISSHDEFDVCLELTWQQHSGPFVEYYFLGNIIDGRLVGEIIEPKRNQKKVRTKLTFKERIEMAFFILIGIAIFMGLPFFVTYALSDNILISCIVGVLPLLALLMFEYFSPSHVEVHKKNIINLVNKRGVF